MKKLLFIPVVLIVAIVIWFAILGQESKSGEAPGLEKGELSPCPNKPNCVSSQNNNDASHYFDPIIIPQSLIGNTPAIQESLKQTIQELGGTIQTDNGSYLAATFSSSIFGFIDDVETRIDTDSNIIHLRSASRAGQSDMGVNKKRAKLITQTFLAQHQ